MRHCTGAMGLGRARRFDPPSPSTKHSLCRQTHAMVDAAGGGVEEVGADEGAGGDVDGADGGAELDITGGGFSVYSGLDP